MVYFSWEINYFCIHFSDYFNGNNSHNPFSDADSTIPSSKSNPDAAFTAATFAQKYKDVLFVTDNRVSVIINVAGESESTDPAKRAKEIRYLQSYVLKFFSFSIST